MLAGENESCLFKLFLMINKFCFASVKLNVMFWTWKTHSLLNLFLKSKYQREKKALSYFTKPDNQKEYNNNCVVCLVLLCFSLSLSLFLFLLSDAFFPKINRLILFSVMLTRTEDWFHKTHETRSRQVVIL